MIYCGPCRNESGHATTATGSPSSFRWLGSCTCAGKFLHEKFKSIVRPERVLFQLVHYAVTGTRARRAKTYTLNMATEGKYAHLRTGFSFESDHSSLLPGEKRSVEPWTQPKITNFLSDRDVTCA